MTVKFNVLSNSTNPTHLGTAWVESQKFNRKNSKVDKNGSVLHPNHSGHCYILASKYERQYSKIEKIGRQALGTILVILTVFTVLCSKRVRKLFTSNKETIRFANEYTLDDISQNRLNNLDETTQNYAKYILQSGNLTQMPRASCGNTPVYFPPTLPSVVFKVTTTPSSATRRVNQMRTTREILNSLKCTHLVIPRGFINDRIIVEERLPINVTYPFNMGLYLSELTLFDEPVREFTRLFSKANLNDLLQDSGRHPMSQIEGVGNGIRYDNLPFYLVEENGERKIKIGLIDLETISFTPDPKSLNTLARIFPYHAHIIREEAIKLGMTIPDEFDSETRKGILFYTVGYSNHVNWLAEKGLLTDAGYTPFEIPSERIDELIPIVANELIQLNQGINPYLEKKRCLGRPAQDFLVGDPEIVALEISKTLCPLIIKSITDLIGAYQNSKNRSGSDTRLTSDIVLFRSPHFTKDHIDIKINQNGFLDSPYINRTKNGYYLEGESQTLQQVIFVILDTLQKRGDIFHFNPGYSTNYDTYWIQY